MLADVLKCLGWDGQTDQSTRWTSIRLTHMGSLNYLVSPLEDGSTYNPLNGSPDSECTGFGYSLDLVGPFLNALPDHCFIVTYAETYRSRGLPIRGTGHRR